MLKIMIADDEQYERDYLEKFIHEKYNNILKVVYKASDGAEVLNQIDKLKPHIILLDIRMPRLDGIEAATQLKNKYPNIQIIIISAYEEFSYAKQAIKIGVNDYLVKPYIDDELQETLNRVISNIDSLEPTNIYNPSQSKIKFDFYEDLEKDLLWNAAFENISESMLEKDLSMWNIHNHCFKCIVFYEESISRMKLTDNEIIKNLFKTRDVIVLSSYLFEQLIVFVFAKEDTLFIDINSCIKRARTYLNDTIKSNTKPNIFCGVSGTYRHMNELPLSYQEAYKYITEFSIFDIQEHFKQVMQDSKLLCESEYKLCFYIINKNIEKSFYWIEKIFSLLKKYSVDDNHILKNNIRRVLLTIIRQINKIPEIRIKTSDAENIFDNLMILPEEQDLLHQYIKNIIQMLIKEIVVAPINNNVLIVIQAKEYIANHYSEPISLQLVAQYLGVSFGYLSKCFKKIEGKNFTDFLTSFRLKIAKEMIINQQYTISEIALKVGFSDPNYFGKCFKKQESLSPTEYQSMMFLQSLEKN